MESSEEWRDVCGYAGHYEISNKGRVKSVVRPVKRGSISGMLKERIIKPHLAGDKTKYLCVLLSKNGVKAKKKVHRLVLEAFRGPKPYAKAVARHLDDDPMNNNVENLCWGSVSENTVDKFLNGYTHHSRLLTDLRVEAILEDDRSQRKIAEHYNVSQKIIWVIKNKGKNPYYGKF